jgi:hypothetical protein
MALMTLDQMVAEFGEPDHALRLPEREATAFKGRVPDALIAFWIRHGFGSYRNGYFVICDPRPFDAVIHTMFEGDPEFHPDDITVVAYLGDSSLLYGWHRDGRKVIITAEQSIVLFSLPSSDLDPETGRRHSDERLIGAYLALPDSIDAELYEQACALHGVPAEREIFGFFPALQLGGDPIPENMQHVKAVEHFGFLAQLKPLDLVVQTAPEPGYPIGQNRVLRQIGRQ